MIYAFNIKNHNGHDKVFRLKNDPSRVLWIHDHDQFWDQLINRFVPSTTELTYKIQQIILNQAYNEPVTEWTEMLDIYFENLGFEIINYIDIR